jgi:hypothetical protein
MPMAPETLGDRLSQGFWKVWERTYVLIFLAFVGLNVLVAIRYGWLALARSWGSGFALVGLAGLGWTWRSVRRANASETWPAVEAHILNSRIEVEREGFSDTHYGGRITYYYPQVLYEYEVRGLKYQSTRLLFVQVNYTRAEAEAAIARYPAGGQAMAHVHPENPRLAVLESGLAGKQGKYAIAALVSGAFAVMGGGVWFLTPLFARLLK